jgi:hypothetical protein
LCLEAKLTGRMRTLSDLNLRSYHGWRFLDFMETTDDNDSQLMINQKGSRQVSVFLYFDFFGGRLGYSLLSSFFKSTPVSLIRYD